MFPSTADGPVNWVWLKTLNASIRKRSDFDWEDEGLIASSSQADDYSVSAPSVGSSAASIFESRFMLMAWTSAILCLKVVPLTSSSTSRSHASIARFPDGQRCPRRPRARQRRGAQFWAFSVPKFSA